MDKFDPVFHTSMSEGSAVFIWLKSGAKISGRVKSVDSELITLEVTGEMSEFQNYKAVILKAELSAVAWIVPKD